MLEKNVPSFVIENEEDGRKLQKKILHKIKAAKSSEIQALLGKSQEWLENLCCWRPGRGIKKER